MNDWGLPTLALMVIGACLLDRLLGEPARLHPLVGFGRLAGALETRWNGASLSNRQRQRLGQLAWVLLVLLPTAFIIFANAVLIGAVQVVLGTVILYLVIGGRSLQEHADRVRNDLVTGNLADARVHVSWLVSRDTRQLDETGISKACVESVLENGNDALFAPIFWFCVLGPAGAILYRLANTLDAMWGYRTDRYLNFGRAAAKLDDALNYVPARLTALSYALVGNTQQALRCWQTQAAGWDSPNAGPVMAAGAGALDLRLGGAADYHGATEQRSALGIGSPPAPKDIERAQGLLRHALWLWLAGMIICAALAVIF